MKVIITGASGMVGKGVLLECLDNPKVEKIFAVHRSAINFNHPKLREILVEDFFDLANIQDELKDCQACFFCLVL